MKKIFNFTFSDDCFDRDAQRSDIARSKKKYTKTVYETNGFVEELDRYDDFDSLKIETSKFAKSEASGSYGIPYDITKHTNQSVILKHQNSAAISFLKDLRGFGLLADVVGSGKTFEAALILSELAVRGKIKSLLLVVPAQVYDNWIDVLETQFGLGQGVLFEAAEGITRPEQLSAAGITFDKLNRPSRPIIVKTEDFVSWDASMATLLYDGIVVDEAHHLCKEDGEFAKAMKLLSAMMQTKKRANVTYCLLLSATPHSGNLDHMFRLWYFIRCKGGNPSDFDEKEDVNRSQEYLREKAYYKERICRGATTVMEFIKKVKKSELLLNYSGKFEEYLAKKHLNMRLFEQKAEGEQQFFVDEFLSLAENEELSRKIMRNVANAYHNGVLRSIMIRQPSTALIVKEKNLVNYLYYPSNKKGEVTVKDWYGNYLKVDPAVLHNDSETVTPLDKMGIPTGDKLSLASYVKENHRDLPESKFYSDIICNVFAETVDETAFEKKDFILYYRDQMVLSPDSKAQCRIRPLYDTADSFEEKLKETKAILRQHKKERILIFFDYEKKKNEVVYHKVYEALSGLKEFSSRIIVGSGSNKEKTIDAFNAMEGAILLVTDPSFTEGVNLQLGSVIINFQVTPDPLAMDQRIGRIFRLGQKNNVTIYSLADMTKLEGFALMYFLRIGLMSSNSGDATIIAGSNNERMVAVQCERCGQVKLYSQEDYELHQKNDDLYCIATEECINTERPRGTVMKEISVFDFKCDKCSTVFARSVSDEEGYMCISNTNSQRSIMCNQGDKNDRRLYCRKICAMSHCSRLKPEECPAVNAYLNNRMIGDQDLYSLCETCKNKTQCPEKCRPYVGTNGISACSTCDFAICRPKPHVIEFDDRWEADCPICRENSIGKRGKLKPIVARTFAAYLRAAWDFKHDEGRGFCSNLLREANKVTDIKLVLDSDRNE